MTEYVKSTNFTSKDSLASGNPLKIIKGAEFDTEFNNIATAVSTKADSASPIFTGNVTGTFVGSLTGNVTGNVTGSANTVITLPTSQVLSALAGASASAVGTYMFAATSISLGPSSGIGPGNTVAGSSLYPACVRQPQLGGSFSLGVLPTSGALSGTWMMMGGNHNSDTSSGRVDSVGTLWLRIV